MSERFAFELEVATLTADEVQLVEHYRALSREQKQTALMLVTALNGGDLPNMAVVNNYQRGGNAVFALINTNNNYTQNGKGTHENL